MRRRSLLALFGLSGLVAVGSACASATSRPAAVVAAPRSPKYPQYVQPPVPEALAGTSASTAYNLAWSLLQSGDLKTAERAFATALGTSPSFYPAEAGWGYLDLADGDPAAALTHFDRALGHLSTYVAALIGRGQALIALDRKVEALAAFESALAIDSSLIDLRREVDVLKFRSAEQDLAAARQAARAGNLDEAARAYDVAIRNSLDSAFLYRELAVVERQRGHADRALDHLRRATTLDPSDAASFGLTGELLEARGEDEAALAAYRSALSIEPSGAVEARRAAVRARVALSRLPEEYRAIGAAPQVTRADLAALIGVRLAAILQAARSDDAVLITDARSTWAEPWIMTIARAGVMDPYENHTFQPRAILQRVDLAQAVSRVLQKIAARAPTQARAWENARLTFSDMAQNHLAYVAASTAVAAGVMTSTQTAAFEPSRSVTGAEAVEAISRLEQLADLPRGHEGSRR